MAKHKNCSSISHTEYSANIPDNQVDKAYEEIKGHEKHILFHFFTLFMISFFVGVLLIHLSLWMNSHLVITKQSCNIHSVDDNNDPVSDKVAGTYHTEAEQSNNIGLFQKVAFYYTGYYFQSGSNNVTTNNLF